VGITTHGFFFSTRIYCLSSTWSHTHLNIVWLIHVFSCHRWVLLWTSCCTYIPVRQKIPTPPWWWWRPSFIIQYARRVVHTINNNNNTNRILAREMKNLEISQILTFYKRKNPWRVFFLYAKFSSSLNAHIFFSHSVHILT
jgi:hypothetical protein